MKHLSSLALVALALAACAKKHNDPAPQPVVVPPPAIVGNTYVGDCIPTGRNDFFRTTLTFGTDAKRVEHVDVSNETDCSKVSYSADITSQYNTSGMISQGVLAVDYTLIGITLTPQSDGLARSWNRGGFCQSNSWEIGKAAAGKIECLDRDIFNDVDSAQVFSVVQIAGDDIRLGERNFDRNEDGHTAEKRFTKIANDVFHKKGATPLQPAQPIEVGQCPAFAASYACESIGDDGFANRDLSISVNGAVITVTVQKRGDQPAYTLDFTADGQPHVMANGREFTDTRTSTCSQGKLTSTDVVARNSTTNPYTSKTTYGLRIGADGRLGIDVDTQVGNEAVHSSPRTYCRVF